MKDISDKEHELFILRTQIEARLVNLGLDDGLRRQIVKTVARISSVEKLSALAQTLSAHRKRMQG